LDQSGFCVRKNTGFFALKSHVLLVVSRADVCRGTIANELNILLRSKFEKTQYWKSIVHPTKNNKLCFFAVNNRLGMNDVGIEDLQTSIAKTINRDETFKETYPVAWLKVLDDILDRNSKDITMSLYDFEKDITPKYGIRGEKMIDELCQTFHELGYINKNII
jgi:hypothetical protein